MAAITQDTTQNAVVVANIIEAISGVIKEVAGNDISNQINGSAITRDVLGMLISENLAACVRR